jgi:hypothetical protein
MGRSSINSCTPTSAEPRVSPAGAATRHLPATRPDLRDPSAGHDRGDLGHRPTVSRRSWRAGPRCAARS